MERLYKRADERHPSEVRISTDRHRRALRCSWGGPSTPGGVLQSSVDEFETDAELENALNRDHDLLIKLEYKLMWTSPDLVTEFTADVNEMVAAEGGS